MSLIVYILGITLIMHVKWVLWLISRIPSVTPENINKITAILGIVFIVAGILLSVTELLLLRASV